MEKLTEAGDMGRASWITLQRLRYYSPMMRARYEVPQNFVTDFASVPRLPLMYWLTGDTAHASAVLHDYLTRYALLSWADCARVFREAMKAEGVPAWRRNSMYWAVRAAGVFK